MHRGGQQRILVRSVNWLGDAVISLPAVRRLREAHPSAHIAVLTQAKLAELWQACPDVDTVVPFAPGETALSVARRLRDDSYDVGLIMPNSFRSALEMRLAGVPQRIGYASDGRSLLLTRVVRRGPHSARGRKASPAEVRRALARGEPAPSQRPGPTLHLVHHFMKLVEVLGADPEPVAPRVDVPAGLVGETLSRFGLPHDAPLFGISPGGSYGPAKRWPATRFAETAIEVSKEIPCAWVLFGSPAEAPLAAEATEFIARNGNGTVRRVHSLVGKTSIGDLCALLRGCDLLLTNDSGPMHLAAAVGTPVVALFGSTSPAWTGPGLGPGERDRCLVSHAPCSPCFLRECPAELQCMGGLSVTTAAAAVKEVYAAAGGTRARQAGVPGSGSRP